MSAAVGVCLPYGELVGPDVTAFAQGAEELGAASLWVSDHIVQARRVASHHPFSQDGVADWPADSPWPEAMSSLSWVAAATRRVQVGPCVLVLPQRDPILVAKMAATIDALSGGRMIMAVGAGWMREEFEILGWDFASRGRRTEEAMEVMRRVWQGAPGAFAGEFFTLRDDTMAYPTPVRAEGIPILVGGMSDIALRRAGRVGDGWLALEVLGDHPVPELPRVVDRLRGMLEVVHDARPAGRGGLRNVLAIGRVTEHQLPHLRTLADAGFDEILIDGTWDLEVVARELQMTREALA